MPAFAAAAAAATALPTTASAGAAEDVGGESVLATAAAAAAATAALPTIASADAGEAKLAHVRETLSTGEERIRDKLVPEIYQPPPPGPCRGWEPPPGLQTNMMTW